MVDLEFQLLEVSNPNNVIFEVLQQTVIFF